jgi:transposase-like protein
MIESELEGLRRQLSEVRSKKSTRRRYPKELRQAVQAYIRGRHALGIRIGDVCRELELPLGSASRWLRGGAEETPEAGAGMFRAVVLAPVRSRAAMVSGALSLSSPRGYRAEGLELEQLLFLLRELS